MNLVPEARARTSQVVLAVGALLMGLACQSELPVDGDRNAQGGTSGSPAAGIGGGSSGSGTTQGGSAGSAVGLAGSGSGGVVSVAGGGNGGGAGTGFGGASAGGGGVAGSAGAGSCAAGLLACGGVCVSGANDLANCGACGRACTTGQACVASSCQCMTGLSDCGSSCSNLQADPANCGTCGNVCAAGQVCSNGSCSVSCGSGLAVCGQACVSLATSVSNCGVCGRSCLAGQACQSSACACTGGTSDCAGQCVNTQTNNSHCGTCGTTCSGGRSCSGGACACPSGQTYCGSQCVNTQTSVANCGACGRVCTAGQTCSNGTCMGGGTTGQVFSQCRFHFGTIDSIARNNSALIPQLDFFTPGWMGNRDTFDQSYVCTDTNTSNGVLRNQVPVVVAYVAAFYVKRHHAPLCDCNVSMCGANNTLCYFGSQYIQQDLSAILNAYRSYAQGYASCYGTTRPIVFAMEPDWYQYTNSTQTDPMTPAEAGNIMGQFVAAIRQYLPNAVFSLDISPWVAPNNGGDGGAQWYANFDMSAFTFINTSGGSTLAANTRIRSSNNMTWAAVSQVTGKPILADTGYGASGVSAGHDANWDVAANVNARIADGVVSISQYNPNSSWGSTISSIRGQLNMPRFCP